MGHAAVGSWPSRLLCSSKMAMLMPPMLILFGLFHGLQGQRPNCHLNPLPTTNSTKLLKLRVEMAKPMAGRGSTLEALIITSHDEHQSEFVADRDKRLEYISGFRGTSGLAAVTRGKAAIWVDPDEYWMADAQLECDWLIYTLGNDQNPQLTEWLRRELRTGVRVGADPKLVPSSKWEDWKKELEINHIALTETASNLVDEIWLSDRPSYKSQQAFFIDGGTSRDAKIEMLRGNLTRFECGAMIVTALDEIAWLLNVRGREGTYTPFVRSYLIVTRAETFWYIPGEQRSDFIYKELEKQNSSRIRTQLYDNIWRDLRTNIPSWGKVLIPARSEFAPGASYYIATAVPPNRRVMRQSPIIFLKARKNSKEIQGMKNANLRDSVAIVDFLAFLEDDIKAGGNWTESAVAQKIEEYQRNQTGSQGPAAPVRVAFGPHGALRNYIADNATDVYLDDSSTTTIFSAHHYMDGTTSVARAVHFGTPSLTEVRAYTLILASLIELSRQSFPANLRTSELDILARAPLWESGVNYNHSSGHSIGAFSAYHEPPVNLNRNSRSQMEVLHKGYFISVGPSFAKHGMFGVQLENVLEVVSKTPTMFNQNMANLAFKESTLVPFETKLIEPSLLNAQQVEHINDYHTRVFNEVGAELQRQSRMRGYYWLMEKAKSISPVCNSSRESVPVSLIALIFMFSVRYLL